MLYVVLNTRYSVTENYFIFFELIIFTSLVMLLVIKITLSSIEEHCKDHHCYCRHRKMKNSRAVAPKIIKSELLYDVE